MIKILKTAPDVKILSTSRARLNVQGEHLFPVAGMDYPESLAEATMDTARYSAIELFLTGARRVEPGFVLTDDNLADVARICRLVEGMPLGILLAAAWVGMLSPAEIAAEVSGEISQGLDFLETDLRHVPARQRSMRAVFDHSWNLITARSRAVMQALSVFRGGFTREAAQHVAGGSLRDLKALADRSLLRRTSTGRYEPYHELLRQYAQERLKASGRADRVRQRHSEYYLNVLHQRRADLLLRDYRPLTALPVASREQADVAASPTRTVSQSLIDPLTRRELEVLQLIAAGLSNQEIAEQLVVALSTVKKHINRIYSKLGVKRRTQAVVRARELNLL